MSASSQLNMTGDENVMNGLLQLLESTFLVIFGRSSAGLLPGEATILRTGPSSSAQLQRFKTNLNGQTGYSLCSDMADRNICPLIGLSVLLPSFLGSDLSLANGAIFDLIVQTYDKPPGKPSASPMVVVNLAQPGGTALSVHNLTEPISISLPVNTDGKFSCVFWDPNTATYSENGVKTKVWEDIAGNHDDQLEIVTCLTGHLSAFTIISVPSDPVIVLASNESTYTSNRELETSSIAGTQVYPSGPGTTTSPFVKPELTIESTYTSNRELETSSIAGTQVYPSGPGTTTSTFVKPELAIAIIPGLEIFGPVNVLLPAIVLGTPSADSTSSYILPAPFDIVQIEVPGGAWPQSRRGNGMAQLTATVFVLPQAHNLSGVKAISCGPAVSLGPIGTRLLGQVKVSVPCNGTAPPGMSPVVFAFDIESNRWNLTTSISDPPRNNINGSREDKAIWAQTGILGPLAAGWVLNPPKEDSGLSKQAIIIGVVVGSAFGLLLAAFVIIVIKRRHQAHKMSSDGTVSKDQALAEATASGQVADQNNLNSEQEWLVESNAEVTGALVFKALADGVDSNNTGPARPFCPVSRFAECDFTYTRQQIGQTTRTTSEGQIRGGNVELMSELVFEAPADVIFDVASHDAGTSGNEAEFIKTKVSNDGNGESLSAQVEREFKNAFASSFHGKNGSDEVPFPEFRSQIVFDDAPCAAVEISTSADCISSSSIPLQEPLQEIENAGLDSGQRIHSGDAARTVVNMDSGEGKELCPVTSSAQLQEAGSAILHAL
jgi:hypothetical protein